MHLHWHIYTKATISNKIRTIEASNIILYLQMNNGILCYSGNTKSRNPIYLIDMYIKNSFHECISSFFYPFQLNRNGIENAIETRTHVPLNIDSILMHEKICVKKAFLSFVEYRVMSPYSILPYRTHIYI